MNNIGQFIEQRLEKTLKDLYNRKFNVDQFDIRKYREYFMDALVLVIVKIRDGKIFYKSFSDLAEPDEMLKIINYNHAQFSGYNLDSIKLVGDFEYSAFPSN